MSKLLPPPAKRPGMCTAYGCPLLGTMSASTGGGDWFCFAHHGKDFGRFQRITAELHRLKWLLQAISDIRIRDQHQNFEAADQRIAHDFTLAQRRDLLQGHETSEQWLVRLERELATMLAEPPAPKQIGLLPTDNGLTRVAFDQPAA